MIQRHHYHNNSTQDIDGLHPLAHGWYCTHNLKYEKCCLNQDLGGFF
jgi:hypothetical protein